jgi:ferric-dicitrate binding protein FerR (iron transport regulator)
MISKSLSRKSIAAFVSVAVLSVYSMIALATPGARIASGELSATGNVTVNGQKVISGGTLFSDSVIVTSDDSSATVSISKLGRVQLAPNSSMTLSFNDTAITGMLDSGVAHISTLVGISVNLATKEGSVVADGSQAASFTVDAKRGNTVVSTEAGLVELRAGGAVKQIAAGENATAGTPNPQADKDDDDDLSGGALAALIIGVAVAGGVIFWAITHDNDVNFGGNPIVISPAR